jgi:hypothetical protein
MIYLFSLFWLAMKNPLFAVDHEKCPYLRSTSTEMSVTSSDVDVTLPISCDVGLTTRMWKRLNVYWVFVATVLARKFHKNFFEFPLKSAGLFFSFLRQKNRFLGLKPWQTRFFQGKTAAQKIAKS